MKPRSRPTLDGEEIAIVLLGDFNPKIFQPSWFALEGLIRRSEAKDAEIEIIHRDAASFRLDWSVIDVTRYRFQAKTKSLAHRTTLRDLVVGTFSRLRHTPIRQLGLNLTQQLHFSSDAEWHNFGHFLAPKSPWKDVLKQPGMRGIQLQGVRPDKADGHVFVSVEPHKPGQVSVQVNDHFGVPQDATNDSGQAAAYFIETIETAFERSLERAQHITGVLIDGFMKQEHFDDGTN